MDLALTWNEGLQNWELLRSEWKSKSTKRQKSNCHIDPDTLYEELCGTDKEKDGKLSQRVPLPELVSVLVEGTFESENVYSYTGFM